MVYNCAQTAGFCYVLLSSTSLSISPLFTSFAELNVEARLASSLVVCIIGFLWDYWILPLSTTCRLEVYVSNIFESLAGKEP